MGHKGFSKSDRNFNNKEEMVNGTLKFTEEEQEAIDRMREEFRDEVSKRMGDLLLRGVTMLDQYCPKCNGILMENREGVRTCVTCELIEEKSKEGSRRVAEVPLDYDADGFTPGNSLLAGSNTPTTTSTRNEIATQRTSGVIVMDIPRQSQPSEATRTKHSAPVVALKKSKVSPPTQISSLSPLERARAVVEKKLLWACDELESTEDVERTKSLLGVVDKAMSIVKNY